jgi:hypothetical protein
MKGLINMSKFDLLERLLPVAPTKKTKEHLVTEIRKILIENECKQNICDICIWHDCKHCDYNQ